MVLSTDDRRKVWRTAVEVELTRRPRPGWVPSFAIYRVHPSALTVVRRSVAALTNGSERIIVRPYPPPTLAEVA